MSRHDPLLSVRHMVDHAQEAVEMARNRSRSEPGGRCAISVVVGDRSEIESSIRELQIGDLRFLDADGNPEKSTETARAGD